MPIASYSLYMDAGSLSSLFTLVTTLTADPMIPLTYTVTQAANGIVAGERYRFITVATNALGDSPASTEAWFTATTLP